MIVKIFIREWKRIVSLPAHYLLLLVLPPILFFLFALIYNEQGVENLSMAIWDEDNSELSRTLSFMLEETPSIHFSEHYTEEQDVKQAIRSNKVWGAIHFPRNFEKEIKKGHQVDVTLYTNSAAIVPAKLIYKDAAQVIITGGSGVILQKNTKKGMESDRAMALVQPIKLTNQPLYNSSFNYQEYLTPGLITVALQMLVVMIGVLLINYEYKTETMDELLEVSGGSAGKIIAGKTVAHLTASWFNFILIVGIIFPYFNLHHPGTTFNFFLLYNLLVLACLGFGVLVSSIFKDVMTASDIALFYTSPAFVFSGFTFPRWAMPWYDQFYAMLLPYTPFLDGFLKVYFMELPLRYITKEMGILMIFIGITYPLASIIFSRTLQRRKDAQLA